MEIRALTLDITKRDRSLAMSLADAGEAHSTIRHYAQCPVSFPEMRRLCQELTLVLNKAYPRGYLDPDHMGRLRKTAHLLWNHAVAPSVRDRLKALDSSSLTLIIDEELISVPWELLYDGSDFLCLKFSVGRLVRTHCDIAPREQYRGFSAVPRMLVLANPTNDLQSAYQEGVTLRNRLDGMRQKLRVDFKSTAIDKLYVRKNLSEYDIVHFAGHCEFEPGEPRQSGWVLHDGRLTASDIFSLGAGASMPALIFSNACHSATEDPLAVDVDYQQRNYGIASAFLFSGVRYYIGAVRKIEDSVSAEFAQEFYRSLTAGAPVGESLRSTRLHVIRRYGMERIVWAGYILYGAPATALLGPHREAVSALLAHPHARRTAILRRVRVALKPAIIALVCAAGIIAALQSRQSVQVRRLQSLFHAGRNADSIRAAERILASRPTLLDPQVILADTYYRLGNKEKALQHYFSYALESEKQGDQRHLARAYSSIGWYYHLEGDFDKARDFYARSVDLSRRSKDVLNEAIALRRLAVWYTDKKMYSRALELLTRSSEINRDRAARSYEHRYHLACDYFDLGLVFTNKDDYETARVFYHKSRALFEKLRRPNELSDCWFNLGELYQLEKQYHKALEYYETGLAIDQEQGNVTNLSSDYTMIGELSKEMGRHPEAQEYFVKALALAEESRSQVDIASACRNLGNLCAETGRLDEGCAYLARAFGIYRELNMAEAGEVDGEMRSCPQQGPG